jgi:catechol 2,3-dioxygenase-like lactoylglutathione lyase family enzyme
MWRGTVAALLTRLHGLGYGERGGPLDTHLPENLPVLKVRVARPTNRLYEVVAFYHDCLGLPVIESFHSHAGYSGGMLGLHGHDYHLEFTQHEEDTTRPAQTKDNLLVFYVPSLEATTLLVSRFQRFGHMPVPPENPYWAERGFTFEDPDGWRIVLMNSRGLTAESTHKQV